MEAYVLLVLPGHIRTLMARHIVSDAREASIVMCLLQRQSRHANLARGICTRQKIAPCA